MRGLPGFRVADNIRQMCRPPEVFTLGHSPDPDDAFMFYAIAKNKIDLRGYRFEHRLEDIQTLNERALRGDADAGLIIHEGQLTYAQSGFEKIVDLGEWWKTETELPLPLGGNVIRKDIPANIRHDLCQIMRESIEFGLAHRDEAVQHALPYARDMNET